MKVNYDIMADAVYINVSTSKVAKTVKSGERFLVDVDSRGNVVGIEILDASNQQELIKNLKKNVAVGVPINIQTSTPVIA
ncbi:MAG: DUF2283 domain-containing protein [bacterium]|nr:DUF2283 domain-containing protein [bacterium]